MLKRPIYMDHHATTPTDPRVVEAMAPFFTEHFGNAASRHHAFGWAARDAVEAARAKVATLVGCDPRELYFTAGATESNNLAIKGCLAAIGGARRHIVTLDTEHRAVLAPCRRLEEAGVRVDYVTPGADGRVDPLDVDRVVNEGTALVSVMMANNEIGVLQPVGELATLAHRRDALLHTDATQAVGKIPFSARDLDVDLVSLSAHKIYGPKGVGALCVRRRRPRIPVTPLIDGGGHERGLRSGTLNVPAIVGFGRAAELCGDEMADEASRTRALRDRLWQRLSDRLNGMRLNGSLEHRLPNNLNVSVGGLEGESLLMGLDDVAVSSGAACTSVNTEPSHVLLSLGLSAQLARASLRFGLGRWNTEAEVDYVVDKVCRLVTRLRELSPA